jgi:hypothetical protein
MSRFIRHCYQPYLTTVTNQQERFRMETPFFKLSSLLQKRFVGAVRIVFPEAGGKPALNYHF